MFQTTNQGSNQLQCSKKPLEIARKSAGTLHPPEMMACWCSRTKKTWSFTPFGVFRYHNGWYKERNHFKSKNIPCISPAWFGSWFGVVIRPITGDQRGTPVHPLVIAMPNRNKLTIQPQCWAHHFPIVSMKTAGKLLENLAIYAICIYPLIIKHGKSMKIHGKNIDGWDSQRSIAPFKMFHCHNYQTCDMCDPQLCCLATDPWDKGDDWTDSTCFFWSLLSCFLIHLGTQNRLP